MSSLDQLHDRLSARDLQVLGSIHQFRFLTTHQLARLHFDTEPTSPVPRRTNHGLARLASLGVITHLKRRIGGVRAGSAGYVWTLTDLGGRVLANANRGNHARIRTYEPSATFLEHTLAVAEVALTIHEASQSGALTVVSLELEPQAWRSYLGYAGQVLRLKPDLSAVTVTGEYEDRWFIEVDRDTEPPSRIISKCQAYEQYRASGIEQRDHGIFPAVVWVVPNEARAAQLRRHLASSASVSDQHHAITTLSDFVTLLTQGIEHYNTTHGGQKGGNTS